MRLPIEQGVQGPRRLPEHKKIEVRVVECLEQILDEGLRPVFRQRLDCVRELAAAMLERIVGRLLRAVV